MGIPLNGSMERTLRVKGISKPTFLFRKSHLLLFTVILLLLIGASLFCVWSRIQVIQYGYEISDMLRGGRELAEMNKKLRLQIATLKSYTRIEKIALEDLKMVKPKPDEVIVIR